jgi:hypothetical protein
VQFEANTSSGQPGGWNSGFHSKHGPERAFGPRLQALVAVPSGAYQLSKHNLQQSLTNCFAVELALGGLDETELSACTQICYLSFLMVFMPTNGKTAAAASDVELVKAGKL